MKKRLTPFQKAARAFFLHPHDEQLREALKAAVRETIKAQEDAGRTETTRTPEEGLEEIGTLWRAVPKGKQDAFKATFIAIAEAYAEDTNTDTEKGKEIR